MKMPLVSVIMPTLNSGKYVREAIHSLIAQDYQRFELIVIDGGSTDNTVELLDKYSGDEDLMVIQLPAGLGIAKALNVGLAAAQGEFVARMDADDYSFPSRLSAQVLFLVQNSSIDLVGTGVENFGEARNSVQRPQRQADIRNSYLVNNPFYHPTVMLRRRLIDAGLFRYDETQVCEEDYELWGRLVPRIACANMTDILLRYRLHSGNGHWDPRKHRAKFKAIQRFCLEYGVDDLQLVEALVHFQCSGLIDYDGYERLRDYAQHALKAGTPKLGWIQDAVVRERSYADFGAWLSKASGWG